MQEEESNEGNEGNEGNDDSKREKLTNDLAEIGHVLDDEFCEYVRPDPNQQIALTQQGNIDFVKVWREVEEIDERLLLNDILPPGLHGEKWSGNVTRSALTQYHNDVENYIQKKLAAPPHVWGSDSGAICASPSSSFTGPRTPNLNDDEDDGGDDDGYDDGDDDGDDDEDDDCDDDGDDDDDDDEDDEVGQGRKAISGVGRSPHTGDQHNPCVPAATMLPTNINFSFNINIKSNIKNKNNIVNLFLLYTRQEIYQKDLAGFLGKQFYTTK